MNDEIEYVPKGTRSKASKVLMLLFWLWTAICVFIAVTAWNNPGEEMAGIMLYGIPAAFLFGLSRIL